MAKDQSEDREFNPEEAFLYAFDEAIEITANCLRSVGASDDVIWGAFRRSLSYLIESSGQVDRAPMNLAQAELGDGEVAAAYIGALDSDGPSPFANFQSLSYLASQRNQASRRAASA